MPRVKLKINQIFGLETAFRAGQSSRSRDMLQIKAGTEQETSLKGGSFHVAQLWLPDHRRLQLLPVSKKKKKYAEFYT